MPVTRTSWTKGNSPPSPGRPKILAEVRELARQHTTAAIATLVRIMKDPKAPPHAQVTAASEILDRGYGKATQEIQLRTSPLDELDPADLAALADAIRRAKDGARTGGGEEVIH